MIVCSKFKCKKEFESFTNKIGRTIKRCTRCLEMQKKNEENVIGITAITKDFGVHISQLNIPKRRKRYIFY